MLPLTIKQQKFSKLQSKMNPELQAIQKKYKDKRQDQAADTFGAFLTVNPFGKFILILIVPHLFRVEIEVFFPVTSLGHFPYPQFSQVIVPRAPETLVHGSAGGYLEWDAYPIDFQQVGIGG